jgi:MFS family permease
MAADPLPSTARRARLAITATAFAFVVTMMGTTLPTPLYPIYSDRLGFSDLTVTVLFAVYALGVVAALSLFGGLSDQLGRRPVLMVAVASAAVSAVLFLLPPSLPLLIVARVFSGLGAGLMSGTGTAAIIDLFPAPKRSTAGAIAVGVNMGGLALGTLIAGILATLAPAPLVVPFAVHLALCVLAFAGLLAFAAAPDRPAGAVRIRPTRLRVPREIRGPFVRAVLAAGAGFAVTGVLTSVVGLFLAQSLHLDSHVVAGAVVSIAFAGMAAGQLIARRLHAPTALTVGCVGLVVACGFLAIALATATLVPLIVAATVLGLSGGFCLNAGISTTVEKVDAGQRGSVSSSLFAGLYLFLAVPAIGVGVLSISIGLVDAGLVFAGVVAVLSAIVAISGALARRSS